MALGYGLMIVVAIFAISQGYGWLFSLGMLLVLGIISFLVRK